jgi:hypothetical protein
MSAARSGTLVQRVVGKALRARNPGGDNGLPLQGREHGVEVKRTRSVGIHDEAEGAARYGGWRDLAAKPRRWLGLRVPLFTEPPRKCLLVTFYGLRL